MSNGQTNTDRLIPAKMLGAKQPDRTLKVLIVSEGSPGHLQQSKGILSLIKLRRTVECRTVEIQNHVRGFARPAVRWALRQTSTAWPVWIQNRLSPVPVIENFLPDLVISSGGSSAFANIMLSRRFNCPNLYVSELKGVDLDGFTVVASLDHTNQAPHHVPLAVLPTGFFPERGVGSVPSGDENPSTEAPVWSMLIGGSSRSHRYAESDWIALAEAANKLSVQHGVRWLITTSRRTGRDAESQLEKHLDTQCLDDLVIQSRDDRKVVASFLAKSQRIFVTQDSLTMLSEAISTGKRTYALAPQLVNVDEGCDFDRFLQLQTESQRMLRVPISSLSDCNLNYPFSALPLDYHVTIADQILQRLFSDKDSLMASVNDRDAA